MTGSPNLPYLTLWQPQLALRRHPQSHQPQGERHAGGGARGSRAAAPACRVLAQVAPRHFRYCLLPLSERDRADARRPHRCWPFRGKLPCGDAHQVRRGRGWGGVPRRDVQQVHHSPATRQPPLFPHPVSSPPKPHPMERGLWWGPVEPHGESSLVGPVEQPCTELPCSTYRFCGYQCTATGARGLADG